MGLNFVKTVFNNQFRPGQNLLFLAGCIGELIQAETEFFYEDVNPITGDNIVIFNPPPFRIDSLDGAGVIWCENANYFENTEVGDIIYFHNAIYAANTYEVTDKLSNQAVRATLLTGVPIVLTDATSTDGYLANITPLKGVKYAYNFLEYGYDFTSKIDNVEYQGFETGVADSDDVTPVDMVPTGTPEWQISADLVYIVGGGANAFFQQRFKIGHQTRIAPLFLAPQYEDLLIGKKPDYFAGNKCLNYINKIDVARDLSNPNAAITLETPEIKSNTGWFGEVFNGGKTNYFVKSVVISDYITSDPLPALVLDKFVKVDITISNPLNPFDSTLSRAVVGFNILPDSESQYQFNGRTQDSNFCIDSLFLAAGGALTLGAKYATSEMIIVFASCVKIGDDLKISVIINPGSLSEQIIRETVFQRYHLWVIVEDYSKPNALTDRTNLSVQVSNFFQQLTTIDLIDAETKFIQHSYTDFADGIDELDAFPVDDISVQTKFTIDFTGRETESISIQAIKNRIKLVHDTEAPIILEDFTANTSQYPIIGLQAQNINFSQDRIFKIQEPDKKTISIVRDFAADAGNVKAYKVNFPFLNRWEYWAALANVASAPDGIFDSSEPLFGLNNFWHRLASITGWTIQYELEFDIEQNGELFSQTFVKPFVLHDFNSNSEWTDNSIKTFDIDTGNELFYSPSKLIQGYKDTKIVATFTKSFGLVPALSDVEIELWIETYEQGGIGDVRRASTVYPNFNSFFKIPVTKNVSGNVFTGESLFDFAKLPKVAKFTVYARIYELNGAVEDHFYIINELNEIFSDGLGGQVIYKQ